MRTVATAVLLAGALLFASGCSEDSAGEWRIVFPAARDGEWAMYVVDQAGGAPVRIATAEAPIFEPHVPSPDGRKLILPDQDDLVVMDSDGNERRRLAAGAYWTVAWSPDSKRIAFNGDSPGLSIIGADGKGERRLTTKPSDAEAVWSLDGKRVAFARRGGVMLVDADGTDLRVLWRSRGDAEQLHWSQDGRTLTFVHGPRPENDFGQGHDLVTVSSTTGRLLRRVPRVYPLGRIAWSPDERRIAFTPYRSSPSRIVVMRADGKDRRLLADGTQPVWSPDGQTIVYVGWEAGGGYQLRSIQPDGTWMRRLTSPYPNGVEPVYPAWLRGPVTPTPSPYRLVLSRRPDGAALTTPFPIVELAASRSRVALVSPQKVWAPIWVSTPPLVVWDAQRARTFRLSLASCDPPQSLALLDDRIGFDCPYGHVGFGRSIRVFPTGRPRPYVLAHGYVGEGPPARLPGRVAGSPDLLVFSTSRLSSGGGDVAPEPRLWRVDGSRKVLIVSGPDAGEPAAVDRGRIAVERPDGQIVILRRDGRVLGRIAPSEQPPALEFYDLDQPTVDLSGGDLVVLRGGWLHAYDTRSFRLRRSWRVRRAANLAGVSDGLVAYVVGADVHVLRLRDGRSTTIRAASRRTVKAAITSAGLFYVLHARPTPRSQVPRYELTPFRPNPATVVYVRRAAILRRLG